MWQGWKEGWGEGATLFGEPTARASDPPTSHEAAQAMGGNDDLQREIRLVLRDYGPLTSEQIAQVICSRTNRWRASTVVSATNPKRSGLVVHDYTTNDRGRHVIVWYLPIRHAQTVRTELL